MSKEGRVVVTAEDIDHDRESTWRKTWVIIVVLLLVLFSMTWLFTRPYFEPDIEEEEYPWKVPAEPLVISEDTTWTDRDFSIDQPIVVDHGVNLSIEGCNVHVDPLDLVFWQRPAIRVLEGGSLELVRTRLNIDRDVNMETSVVGNFWLRKDSVPHLTRLVNLGNATDPVISFDYRCRYAPVPIAIGVKAEHQPDFKVLVVFEPEATDVGNWTTVTASLKDYAGSRPQVVIFPHRFPEGLMFVSDLHVEDDGMAPRGDWFETGHPLRDGWDTQGFSDLQWLMEDYINGSHYSRGLDDLWRGLIEADGDVTIIDSRVLCPEDVPRKGARERVKESLEDDPAYNILGTASRGGHIMVNGARLTIRGSEIVNVPVLCNGTILDINDVDVEGDADMFTLNASRGTFEQVEFTMRGPAPGLPFRDAYMRPLWALGIEEELDGDWTEVLDCTFVDCQQAIDLDDAFVKLVGCWFEATQRLAIWDHDSSIVNSAGGRYEDWDEIEGSNTFHDCEWDIFLKTELTTVHFEVPHGSDPVVVLGVNGPRHGLPLYSPPDWHFLSYEGYKALVIRPVALVDDDGQQHEAGVVRIEVTTDSSARLYPILDPGDPSVIIDLTGDHPEPVVPHDPLEFWGFSKNPGQPVGQWVVKLGVIPTAFDATDLRVSIDINGGDENETEVPYGTSGGDHEWVYFNVDIVSGLNLLNASVTGVPNDDPGGDHVVLQEATFQIMRLEGDLRDLPPETLFEMDGIAIESGEEVLLGHLSPIGTKDYWHLHFAGLSSSMVTIEGLSLPGGDMGISMEGNVSLDLSNVTLGYLGIMNYYGHLDDGGFDPTVAIDGMVCDSLSISAVAKLELTNITSRSRMRCTAYQNDVSIRDCEFNGYGAAISTSMANISIGDCEVATDPARGIEVEIEGTGQLHVANCSFDGSHLAVLRSADDYDLGLNLSILDNEFIGDGAVLYVGYNLFEMDSYDLDPDYILPIEGVIEDNTFRGEGSGVVLWHGLFERLFQDNKVIGQARLHAYYVLTFRVRDLEGTPPRPEFWIVPTETVEPSTLFDDRRYLTLEGEMMLDVTDDPSVESDPPEVGVILLSGYAPSSKVGGFAPIDPLVDAGELILYGGWEDMGEYLLDHVKDWPGQDD